ncbi:hypothetical protein Tco_0311529 [Tanacetum coccineum]
MLCLSRNQDHIPACLAHMLYCVATSTQYNLAFFVAKRIEFIRSRRGYILPYGMLLTRLFRHVMDEYPRIQSDQYGFIDRVMLPLNDDKTRVNEGTYRVSTPSPATYYNSLPQDVPQIFFNPPPHEKNMENLFTRQTSKMN